MKGLSNGPVAFICLLVSASWIMDLLGQEARLDRFDLILLGDDVSRLEGPWELVAVSRAVLRKKPDPLIYNLASERLEHSPSA